jgi:hypothetical protein
MFTLFPPTNVGSKEYYDLNFAASLSTYAFPVPVS